MSTRWPRLSFGRCARRSAVVATAVTLALGGVALPARATDIVQAEAGYIDDPGCGDDGPMRAEFVAGASGSQVVFHPSSGCSQTFGTSASATLGHIRYFTTGSVETHCGRFYVSGALSGSTATICASNDTWITARLSTTRGAGSYTITWVTEGGTPAWVNAYVDYHSRAASSSSPPPPNPPPSSPPPEPTCVDAPEPCVGDLLPPIVLDLPNIRFYPG